MPKRTTLTINLSVNVGPLQICPQGKYFDLNSPKDSFQPLYLDGTTGFTLHGVVGGDTSRRSVSLVGDMDGDGTFS